MVPGESRKIRCKGCKAVFEIRLLNLVEPPISLSVAVCPFCKGFSPEEVKLETVEEAAKRGFSGT